MNGLDTIKRFIGSSPVLDRIAREVFETIPLALRYRTYYGKTFLSWLAFLKESEYWDRDRFEAFQLEELRKLLNHADMNVPYYKRLFADHGFKPQKIQSISDIEKLPYLTREIVKENVHDFLATNIPYKELIKTTTSGSTGIPLTVYKTRESAAVYQAFLLNLLSRVGFNSKKRAVIFQWHDIILGTKKGLNFLRYGNKLVLSAANVDYVNKECMKNYHDMIMKFGPEFISGYVTVLLSMAFFMREQGLSPFSTLKTIFAHSEAISSWQRKIIEESFGARVFSTYGLHEGVIFGGWCKYTDHYHIYPQRGITEFIERDGNYQEIVGSGLNNYAMPFIRYRTMDIGVKGPPGCGTCKRNHRLIEKIEGRIYEFLVNKEGKLYPAIMAVDSKAFYNIKQFQFFQDEPGIAHLKLVKGARYSDSDTPQLQQEISRRFHGQKGTLKVKILFVENIHRTPSGKILRTDQRLQLKDFIPHEIG
jgi:phenylacetate-CoA ligase